MEQLEFIEKLIQLTEKYTLDELEVGDIKIKKSIFYRPDIEEAKPEPESEEDLLFNP